MNAIVEQDLSQVVKLEPPQPVKLLTGFHLLQTIGPKSQLW